MKNLLNRNYLCLVFLFLNVYSIVAQNVNSVNGATGTVELNLEINDHNLSITGGTILTIPVSYDTLWTELGSDISSTTIGNVGIGTDTLPPDAKLTVKGKIHTEELIVKLNVPGPDYVFEKNYQLMNINKLEEFIKQNHHLPEVPSAQSIKKNGVNLSEMNMTVLKKVEELALYIINHEKRICKLENQ